MRVAGTVCSERHYFHETGDEKRKEQWLKLKKAYDTLKDEEERNFYDKWRRGNYYSNTVPPLNSCFPFANENLDNNIQFSSGSASPI